MNTTREVVAALRAHRIRAGLTQGQMGRRMHVEGNRISQLEMHRNEPLWSTLARYAEALDLDLQVRLVPREACGTRIGYRRHQRAAEPACAPCKAAEAAHSRDRRAAS